METFYVEWIYTHMAFHKHEEYALRILKFVNLQIHF